MRLASLWKNRKRIIVLFSVHFCSTLMFILTFVLLVYCNINGGIFIMIIITVINRFSLSFCRPTKCFFLLKRNLLTSTHLVSRKVYLTIFANRTTNLPSSAAPFEFLTPRPPRHRSAPGSFGQLTGRVTKLFSFFEPFCLFADGWSSFSFGTYDRKTFINNEWGTSIRCFFCRRHNSFLCTKQQSCTVQYYSNLRMFPFEHFCQLILLHNESCVIFALIQTFLFILINKYDQIKMPR